MRWDRHVWCMRAMPGYAIDDAAIDAHLRPASKALWAGAAATIVMHHDTSADAGGALSDGGPDRCDDAAGFVSGDHRTAYYSKPKRRGGARRAIELQIAAAHA